MNLAGLFAALLIALLLTLVFSAVYRGGGAWNRVWVFFALIFLFALAGGLWMRPYGPVYWGVPWFGIITWALLISLLLAFAAPPRTRRPTTAPALARREVETEGTAVNAFFWVLIALLLIAIVWAFTTAP